MDYPIAWDHLPTRRAWTKHMAMTTIGLLGWFVAPWALLYVLIVFTSPAFIPVFVIPICYALYRTLVQLSYFQAAVRIQRILWNYPWQVFTQAPYSLKEHPTSGVDAPWMAFPNPADPDEHLPLHFLKHYRAEWWSRRMAPRAKPELKAQLQPIWFAGDPRFFGVIAVTRPGSDPAAPEPKRLHVLFQAGAYRPPADPNPWQAEPADVARAQQAGARGAATS